MITQHKNLTPAQALQSIKQYCAYQERCHSEVREKLLSFGINSKESNEITAVLIEENYLNEERFAIQFAGGKFRMKQWGKQKIKAALKQKQVSEYCVKKALQAIDETAYLQCFNRLTDKKKKELKPVKNIFIKKSKLRNYLLQKGYEAGLVQDAVSSI